MEFLIRDWTAQVSDVLRSAGPLPLASLARAITGATTNEVAMAVGWLARAGEIHFNRREGLWTIELQRPGGADQHADNLPRTEA